MTGKRICCCLVVFVLVLGADCRPPRGRPCGLRMVPESGVINARPGSHVSFICSATCLGPLSRGQLLWKDPRENILSGLGRRRLHSVSYNRWMVTRLMLRRAMPEDSGVYTCEVVHRGRLMRYTASLQVQDNPPPRRDDGPRRGDIYIEPEPDFGDIRPVREASGDPARRYRSRQGKTGPQRSIYPGGESGGVREGEGEMKKVVIRARRQADNNHSFPAGGFQNSSMSHGNASDVTMDPVTGDSTGFAAATSDSPPSLQSNRSQDAMTMMGPNITSPVPSPTPNLSTRKTSPSPKDSGSSSSPKPYPASPVKPDPSSSAKLDSMASAYASAINTTADSHIFTTPTTSPIPITTTQTSSPGERSSTTTQTSSPGQRSSTTTQISSPGQRSSTTTQTSSPGQRSSTTTQTSSPGQRSSTTTQTSSPGQRSSSPTGSSSSGSSSPGPTTTAAGSVVGHGGASSSTQGSSSTGKQEDENGAKHSESKGGEEEGGETAFGRYGLVAFCLILVIALLLLAALLLVLLLPRCCPHRRLFIFNWGSKDGDQDQDRPPKSTPNNQDGNVVLLGERSHRPLAPMTSATGLNGEFITPVDLDAKGDEGETGEKEVKKAEGGAEGDKPKESYVSTFLIGRLSSSKPAEDDPAPPMVAGNTGDTVMEDNVFGPATSTPVTQDKVKKEEDTSSSDDDDRDDHRHGDSKDISSSDSFKDAASTGLDSDKVRSGQKEAEVKPKSLDNGGGVMAEVHMEIDPSGGMRVENAHTDV